MGDCRTGTVFRQYVILHSRRTCDDLAGSRSPVARRPAFVREHEFSSGKMRFPAWGPGRLAFAGFTHFYAPGAKLKISLETAAMKCGETNLSNVSHGLGNRVIGRKTIIRKAQLMRMDEEATSHSMKLLVRLSTFRPGFPFPPCREEFYLR